MKRPTPLSQEFATLKLGDRRLDERAGHTMSALSRQPSASLPKALSPAELEGHYRFVRNEKVSFEALLQAHGDATRARAQGEPLVVVAHDTTDFRFRDEVRHAGLGPMDNGGQGFYAHFALATTAHGMPLGVVGLEHWVRESREPSQPKPTQQERYQALDKESLRWARMVHQVERQFAGVAPLIHVMDREADDFDLLAELLQHDRRFVIRASSDRRITTATNLAVQKLNLFVATLPPLCTREAELAGRGEKGRPAKERKRHPPRAPRRAVLTYSAGAICVPRPAKASKELPAELVVNVVYVNEMSPPAGATPVRWILYTREPIATAEDVLAIVDYYRCRWRIEEYFKALKTGCAFETRQHESKAALLCMLAITVPIAWSLLNLCTLARSEELAPLPASLVFTPTQLRILLLKAEGQLPVRPTIRQAFLGIARFLGGHRGKGEPGWQVLGRGYFELLLGEVYWNLAVAAGAVGDG